jgi:hypothetical protein
MSRKINAWLEHTPRPGAGVITVKSADHPILTDWLEKGVRVYYRESDADTGEDLFGMHMHVEQAIIRLRKYGTPVQTTESLATVATEANKAVKAAEKGAAK